MLSTTVIVVIMIMANVIQMCVLCY